MIKKIKTLEIITYNEDDISKIELIKGLHQISFSIEGYMEEFQIGFDPDNNLVLRTMFGTLILEPRAANSAVINSTRGKTLKKKKKKRGKYERRT